ncbi:hypothetical protein DSOL_3908 [Desulfosporosinus metallidurans]|uniref:Uncharacterized protein n=1 Tax=Desulfosporosinus metallidurans TaxID=1888891 RepID=A0A1Q8QMU7_9FIRM|nr:hypothetical protein DSOL_3908 [Desulfosporosinus metallidurans]
MRRGKPVIKPEEYLTQNVSGITVYYDRYLRIRQPLIIDTRKILGISSLVLDGWAMV